VREGGVKMWKYDMMDREMYMTSRVEGRREIVCRGRNDSVNSTYLDGGRHAFQLHLPLLHQGQGLQVAIKLEI